MKVFYHHLQRGLPRAEALRRAKMRFIESGSNLRNPHYWAAFVLTGDGAAAVPTAIRWTTIAAVLAIAFIVVLLWAAARRRSFLR